MPGDESTNPAVLADRLKRVELDILDIRADVSKHVERLQFLSNDKLSRDEFSEWTKDTETWRELVVVHLERIDGRLGLWAGGSVVITLIAATVAAVIGHSP